MLHSNGNTIWIIGSYRESAIDFIQIAQALRVIPILGESPIELSSRPIRTHRTGSVLQPIAGLQLLQSTARIASILVSKIRLYLKSICHLANKDNLIFMPVLVNQNDGQPVVVIVPRGLT